MFNNPLLKLGSKGRGFSPTSRADWAKAPLLRLIITLRLKPEAIDKVQKIVLYNRLIINTFSLITLSVHNNVSRLKLVKLIVFRQL